MKKMPIIFDMTFDNEGEREVLHTIREEIRDLVNKTLAEGNRIVPTFKRDGTAVFCDADGKWFTRRAVKTGKQAPEGFISLETDPNTGTTFGWEPKDSSPMKKFLNKAIEKFIQDNGAGPPRSTTFELLGPKINGNPERVDTEELRIHGQEKATDFPAIQDILDSDEPFEMLKPIFANFRAKHIEGIVFWIADADGSLIEPRFKVRCKDFFPEMDTRPKPSRNRRQRGRGKRR
jgi:PE-PGRS family protein